MIAMTPKTSNSTTIARKVNNDTEKLQPWHKKLQIPQKNPALLQWRRPIATHPAWPPKASKIVLDFLFDSCPCAMTCADVIEPTFETQSCSNSTCMKHSSKHVKRSRNSANVPMGRGFGEGNAWNECGIPSQKNNGNAETNVATNPEQMRNTHAGKHAGHECAHKRRCKWSGTWARRQTRKRNKTNHACALQGRPDCARCTQHNEMTTTCRRRDQTQKMPQRTET